MRLRKCRTEKKSTTDNGRGVSFTRWWRGLTAREGANWLDMIGNSRACIEIKNNITTLLDFLIVFYLVVTAESVYIYNIGTLSFCKEFLIFIYFLVASKNPFPIITVGIVAMKFQQLMRCKSICAHINTIVLYNFCAFIICWKNIVYSIVL